MTTTAKKTAGRKALAPAAQVRPEFIGKTPDDENQALETMHERQLQLVEQFGDGLPWHLDHYEAAIRREVRRGCESFLRAGSYLVVARECALHGEWRGMLDRLGIEESQARRMMEAARRIQSLPNRATSHDLIQAAGNQSKLIELLSLPDDQFTELAVTGEAGDLSIDEIEAMSTRELREAIREARADIAAKDERNQKLTEAVERAKENEAKAKRKWQAGTPDEQLQTLLRELEGAANSVRFAIAAGSEEVGLSAAIIAVINHAEDNNLNVDAQVAGVISDLINDLRTVRDHDLVGAPILMDRRLAEWQQAE
mgnify:FL=1